MGLFAIMTALGLLFMGKANTSPTAPRSTEKTVLAKAGELWTLVFRVAQANLDADAQVRLLEALSTYLPETGVASVATGLWTDPVTLVMSVRYAKDTTLVLGQTVTAGGASMTLLSATRSA